MIFAIALDLPYEEVFRQVKSYTSEEMVGILEQEVIDKKLFKKVCSIYYQVLKSGDTELLTKYVNCLANVTGLDIQRGVKIRLERSQNQISEDIRNGHEFKEDYFNDISRCEATRLFYSLSRSYAINYRRLLLQALDGLEEPEKPESESALKGIIELSDDSYLFSIHGKQLSQKEMYSIIEHHLTARKIEEMYGGRG